MNMNDPVFVYAEYTSGCLCDRVKLQRIQVPYRPRFNWRRAVQQVAKLNGIQVLSFGKYKSALGELPRECQHRSRQAVRFDWSIY